MEAYTKGLLDLWVVRAALVLVGVYGFLRWILLPPYRPKPTPEVANLPGPDSVPWIGWLIGNLQELQDYQDTIMHPRWIEMGWTGRCQHICGQDTIWTFDPVSLGHILQQSDIWVRPSNVERILGRITGDGLLTARGTAHRRQRKIINPAFSTNAIKQMVPRMYAKADELSALIERIIDDDRIESFASQHPAKDVDRVPGARKVNFLGLTSKFTQDVIGSVGFNVDFQSLQPKENPLDWSINRMLNVIFDDTIILMAQNLYWAADKIPLRNRRAINHCRGIMERLSARLIAERRKTKEAEAALGDDDDKTPDVLDLLVQASSSSAREDQRLSDNEVRSQMATLLFAGSTTTAGTICSVLHNLALYPELQTRLRQEIEALGDEHPDFDTLNNLPFLQNVVRETLRLEPPATCTVRIAEQDTVIPLGVPVRGRDGTLIEKALPVRKGTYVLLSISTVQRHPDIWGADAAKFNPDRFNDPSIPKMNIPGMWGGLAAFISGPHHCIGWRLALAEIKVAVYTLVRNFTYEELPSKPEIYHIQNVACRPEVRGESGGQLPLLVRRVEAS